MAVPGALTPLSNKSLAGRVRDAVRDAFGAPTAPHIPVDNPVSLDASNLGRLRAGGYTVAYKADGVRYLLVLTTHRGRPLAAMVDRSGRVYELRVRALQCLFERGCVYDGELCERTTGHGLYDYLVFNALVHNGVRLRSRPYAARLTYVDAAFSGERLGARQRAEAASGIHPMSARLTFVAKERDRADRIRSFHRRAVPPYRTDGFVFTPDEGGVVAGRDDALLKWKRDNPLDVRLVVRADETFSLYADNDGGHVDLENVVGGAVTLDAGDPALRLLIEGQRVYHSVFGEGEPVFDHVVEVDCSRRGPALHLRFLRLRPDKDGANNADTVRRTLRTIADGITLEAIYELYSRSEPT